MTVITIIRIAISLSITILTCTNPFSITITILLVALSISGLYATLYSSWLAFLLFLIYVGGILVIFSYFLAIIPNQHQFNYYLTIIPLLSITIFTLFSIFISDTWTSSIPNYSSLTTIIFNPYNLSTLILLVLILLFTIIVVIKACKIEKGPLRSFISLYV